MTDSPSELSDPVVVDFPLRGDGWLAPNSPANRIPSHGTDMLGQRYAFDLLRVDGRHAPHTHPVGYLRQLLIGVPTRAAYAWGASVHAPFDGVIVRSRDGIAEPGWLHPLIVIVRTWWNGATFRPSRLDTVLGNHIILQHASLPGLYAGFAHFAPGTVAVRDGQPVATGDLLGQVGHTGNSTSPHLHFQLMDSADLLTARGVPCAFRGVQVERDGAWTTPESIIPGASDRLRCRA